MQVDKGPLDTACVLDVLKCAKEEIALDVAIPTKCVREPAVPKDMNR